jgi:hypothetical protein
LAVLLAQVVLGQEPAVWEQVLVQAWLATLLPSQRL